MKKTTSSKLSKQLTKYGALSAAILGVADANGQSIVYNDIADYTGGAGDTFLIDLNNDGIDDFQIRHNDGPSSSANLLYLDPLAASNEALGSGGPTYAYPFVLSSDTPISSGASSWFNNGFSNGFQSLNYGNCSYGNWCSITDGFLGLRFNISGSIHYGWVRLDVNANGDIWIVKAYAYNDIPGMPLNAGQQILSVNYSDLEDIKIIGLNTSVGLYNLSQATNYRLLNMTGKEVLKGTATDSNHVIETNTIANGIYIIELTTVHSKAVIRKKIVL